MKSTGIARKYGNNVDTDVILPARYIILTDPADLAKHCLEDLDRDFAREVQPGDVLVAGNNFGCGSSREHAPISIQANGVACVIAKSFARIFYRNAINIGLPIVECPEAVDGIENGDELCVDLEAGYIQDLTSGRRYRIEPFPPFIQRIIQSKGLVNYTINKKESEERS